MALKNIEIPLWDSMSEDNKHILTVNEADGKIWLHVLSKEDNYEIEVGLYWYDLKRAWEAIKKD